MNMPAVRPVMLAVSFKHLHKSGRVELVVVESTPLYIHTHTRRGRIVIVEHRI